MVNLYGEVSRGVRTRATVDFDRCESAESAESAIRRERGGELCGRRFIIAAGNWFIFYL